MTTASMQARLIYYSEPAESTKQQDLLEILETSLRYNRATDISGLLISDDHYFMQVIEGPPRNINDLLARLQTDPRHTQLTLIDYSLIETRIFADWFMAGTAAPNFVNSYLQRTFGGFEPANFTAAHALEYLEIIRDRLLEDKALMLNNCE